jgi:hypothetical protein
MYVFALPRSLTHIQNCLFCPQENIIEGIGIGVLGLAFGIGLVAFTENRGERAKQRGGGLSETMADSNCWAAIGGC